MIADRWKRRCPREGIRRKKESEERAAGGLYRERMIRKEMEVGKISEHE